MLAVCEYIGLFIKKLVPKDSKFSNACPTLNLFLDWGEKALVTLTCMM